MKEYKLFENVEIKNFISIVVVLILVGVNIYGCICGQFAEVFEFDKQIIMMVVSFFLGSKVAKTETVTASIVEPETVPVVSETEYNE